MAAVENERELTTTLNLGLRGIDTPGEISPAQQYLQKIEPSIRAIIDQVCAPGSDKAMLVIHRGPAQGSRFLLDAPSTSIGRSPVSVTEKVLHMGDELLIGKFHALFFGNSHIKSLGEKK